VDFLRQDLKQKKIGVHGESLGGIAVTHIGRTKNIDFLCADRTFSGVSAVPDISFGSKIASMFRIITLWDDRIAKDYAESQCYKIITYDPKDEIIHLLSSLKYGVTSQVALQKLGITEQSTKTNFKESYSLFSPYRVINIIQKLIKVIRFEFWQKQTQETLENDKSLLTKSQTLALFWAFHRISELFISMSSLNALNPRKKTKSPNKNNNMGPKMSSNSQVGKPGQTGFDTSVENSLNKNTRMDTQNNKEPINDPRQMLDESVSFISDKILNQSIESGIGTNENELLKSTETKSYKDMFDFEAQSSSAIIELLVKVIKHKKRIYKLILGFCNI